MNNKLVKRIISIMLMSSMVFTVFFAFDGHYGNQSYITAYASEPEADSLIASMKMDDIFFPEYEIEYASPEYADLRLNEGSDSHSEEDLCLASDTYQDTCDQLYAGFLNLESTITPTIFDYSDCATVQEAMKKLLTMARDAQYDHPEMFYVDETTANCRIGGGRYVFSLEVTYLFDTSQIPSMKTELENKISEICADLESQLPANAGDFEKALVIHDYICAEYKYDQTLEYGDLYTFLINGYGVCRAYAAAYRVLAARLNLDSLYCWSYDMGHIWNTVCVNDNWYQIDCTWDDPSHTIGSTSGCDILGMAYHTYFLCSDALFLGDGDTESDGDHFSWEAQDDVTCTSTIYDSSDFYLRSIIAPVAWLDGNWYFILYSSNKQYLISCSDPETCADAANITNYTAGFQPCSLQSFNGKLYMSSYNWIKSLDLAANSFSTKTIDYGTGRYVLGFRVYDDGIKYMTAGIDSSGALTDPEVQLHLHTLVSEGAINATCTQSGLTALVYCSECGDVKTEQETIAQTDHIYGAWISNTCGTHTRLCSACGISETENCSYEDDICVTCGGARLYENLNVVSTDKTDIKISDFNITSSAVNREVSFSLNTESTCPCVVTVNNKPVPSIGTDMAGNHKYLVTAETTAEIKILYKGDLDGNGSVGIEDVAKIVNNLRTGTAFTEYEAAAGSVDGDGRFSLLDAIIILNQIYGAGNLSW